MKKEHEIRNILPFFLEYLDVEEKTLKNYESALLGYIEYLEKSKIVTPTRKDIIAYKNDCKKKKLKGTTIQKYIVVIKRFYRWARMHVEYYNLPRHYLVDIAEEVKGMQVEDNFKKEPLSIAQVQDLLVYYEQQATSLIGKRNYAIVLLMVITGVRTIEVVRATIQDFRIIDGKSILYVHGKAKSGSNLFVKLPQVLIVAIREYLCLRIDDCPFLFANHQPKEASMLNRNTVGSIVRSGLRAIGVANPRITPHSLRHTAAYINLTQGGSLLATQKLLRHRDINTTLIYVNFIDRLKDDSEDRIALAYFTKGEEPNE